MSKTIWVLVEIENGRPARSSLEVLGKAASLGRAEAIVLGSHAAEVASGLGEFGAEKVYAHNDPAYDTYLTLPAVDTLSGLLKQHQPDLLLHRPAVRGRHPQRDRPLGRRNRRHSYPAKARRRYSVDAPQSFRAGTLRWQNP